MNKTGALFFLVIVFIIIFIYQPVAAEKMDIHINGKNLTADLAPVNIEDNIMVKARTLADHLDCNIHWMSSIKTLKLEKEGRILKMMVDSPYLQVGGRTIRLDVGLHIIEGTTYVPLEEVGHAFGYLTETDGDDFFVFKPESLVQQARWSDDRQSIIIEMNKITPYRVYKSEDGRELYIEIDKTSLAKDFIDDLSNKNYFLRVNRDRNEARLKLVIISKYAIPYQVEKAIEEKDDNIIVNFFPAIESIKWTEKDQLEIHSTGKLTTPEITMLKDPERMVLDFPRIMHSDFDLELEDNDWIEDIRVSQFTYDPLTLRMVVELKGGKQLRPAATGDDSIYSLQVAEKVEISGLDYSETAISFKSTIPLEPEFFTLSDPDRLVVNVQRAERASDLPDTLDVRGDLIRKIRTSRFNEDTIRLVVDLVNSKDYNWQQHEQSDGYLHTISFANRLQNIELLDKEHRSGIQIDFEDQVEYEIKKFSYPDRLIVDIRDGDVVLDPEIFPEGKGIIKNIRSGGYSYQQQDYVRLVFDLSEYNGHELLSSSPGKDIDIVLPRGEIPVADDGDIIIVLDPGHGGFDPGAVGFSGLQEKKVNLAISKKVAELLDDSDQDYRIMMTREEDVFVTLQDRVKMANEIEATLFISIHANSASRDYSEGTETFNAPDKSQDDVMLARILQDELQRELKLMDRGVKEENFYVIKYTEMPAALVEIAFLSNPDEESLLDNHLFRERAAGAIVRGIERFLEAFDE